MIQRIIVLCMFLALVAALSCSDRDTICECDPPSAEEPDFGESMEDSIVRANCYILRDAVEAFAMDNLGEYPRSVEDDRIENSYKDLKDYLPEGLFLWNPYTWWRLEPTVEIASSPGEIGLLPIMEGDFCMGYYITGYGQDSIIVELTDTLSSNERAVIENCILLRDAAVQFAFDNFDEYPYSLRYDQSDSGMVLLDYLPDGNYLENVYTGEFTEPSNNYWVGFMPDAPGEIAYNVNYWGGFYIGYEISGFGDDRIICRMSNILDPKDEQVIGNCFLVRGAAELFAAENGGVYPANVGVPITPLGNTLIDLLPAGTLLINPYTLAASEPIDGTAATQGQTGYVPIVRNLINAGYTITGTGRYAGVTIITLTGPPGIR